MPAKSLDRITGYLNTIRDMAPLVAEHRSSFDRERRLPNAVFEALAKAGMFRLWLPEALGGLRRGWMMHSWCWTATATAR